MEENKNQLYKIVKTNEETNICIIRDKYLNYGLSDKNLNIILPAEYMNIQFFKNSDTNILLTKKDKNGIPKYGIADKYGKIIIEPIYGSIKYNKTKDKYVLVSDTFNPDEKILVDINTGLTENNKKIENTKQDEVTNNEYYNKGVEYLNAKDFYSAYQCFEQALDIEQNNEYYKVLQLQCKYEYIQNEESVEKEFLDGFIEECSDFLGNSSGNYNISIYFWRGVVLYFLGKYDDAAKDLDKVVQKEQNAQAFYYLGCIYLDKSRYNKTLEYYDKAIEIDSNYTNAYRLRGKTKFYLNIPTEESIEDCYKAYELDKNYSLTIENIILYLLILNDNYKGLHYCDELIEKDTDRAKEVYLLKSIIYFHLNDIDNALENFRQGYEWYNEMVDYHKRMVEDLTNHAKIVEESFYINEKKERISSILKILQTLNQELQKTVKICDFCGKIEDKDRFIINKGDECICNECLALCNEILEEDGINTNYITVQHSENSNSDLICSFCGRTKEEVDKIIQADNHCICNGCVGILNKVYKNKSDFDTEYKKTIEEMKENHNSFYSTDENADSNYLKDKSLYIYGKELAYKYLVKAAHILKRHNCNKKDRQKIIKYLHNCSEYYVNSAVNVDFNFGKPEMERLLTVGMEVAFHRIVVMYKNNILNNPTYAEEIIDIFASMVCAVEMNYIKDKDKLKDEYHIAITIYYNELKNELKEWLENGKITKEQYNHALDKSGLIYLTPEITKLMKSNPFKFSRMGYMILFIVVWVIFKLIIFYTKHH